MKIPKKFLTIPELLKSINDVNSNYMYHTFFGGKYHLGSIIKKIRSQFEISTPGENGYVLKIYFKIFFTKYIFFKIINYKYIYSFDVWYATERQVPLMNPNCGCFDNSENNLCDTGVYKEKYFNYEYDDRNNVVTQKKSNKFIKNPNEFLCENYYFENETYPKINTANPIDNTYNQPIIGDDSEFIINRFEEFIDNYYYRKIKTIKNKIHRFFAILSFHAPHAPFVGNEKNRKIVEKMLSNFNDDQLKCGEVFNKQLDKQLGRKICRERFSNSYCTSLCKQIKTEYYASLLSFDDSIKLLMDVLNAKNIYKDTIIIFQSDNGAARFDSSGKGVRYIGKNKKTKNLIIYFI